MYLYIERRYVFTGLTLFTCFGIFIGGMLVYVVQKKNTSSEGFILSSTDVDFIQNGIKENIDKFYFGSILRLSFHDCVGPNGCDGCVNYNDPSNAGAMLVALDTLNRIYDENNYSDLLSRSDYYVLATYTALQESIKLNNQNCTEYCMPTNIPIPFYYGREDCDTSPHTNDLYEYPSGIFDYSQMITFFKNHFGFTSRETTALLGAHTLGGAGGASGYNGTWTSSSVEAGFHFNNEFYAILLDKNITWIHLDKSNFTKFPVSKWQWEGYNKDKLQVSFMLNPDIALIRNLELDETGKSSCNMNNCSLSPTASLVELYGRDANAWLKDFISVFIKLTNTTSSQLKRLHYSLYL